MRNFAIGLMVCGALLSACGSQQPPPPPLSVATEAPVVTEDKTPAPLTGAQLLAQQPAEVQVAIRLARRIDDYGWQLDEKHERELRNKQRSQDVIKSRAHDRQRGAGRDRDRTHERRGQSHG